MDPAIHWKKDGDYASSTHVHYNNMLIASCSLVMYSPYLVIYNKDYYMVWSTSFSINSGKYDWSNDRRTPLSNDDLEFVNKCVHIYHERLNEQIIVCLDSKHIRDYIKQN